MPKTYNSIPTVITGDVYTATAHNNIVTNVNNYRVPPACRVRRSAALSFASGSIIAVNFDAEDIDTDGMFTATTNQITVQTAGVYALSGTLCLNANASGQRYCAIVLNPTFSGSGDTATITAGTRITAQVNAATVDTESAMTCATTYNLAAGDRIALLAFQASGTSLGMNGTVHTSLSATWLGQVS